MLFIVDTIRAKVSFNSWNGEQFWACIKLYLDFEIFLNIEMVQLTEVFPGRKKGPFYATVNLAIKGAMIFTKNIKHIGISNNY